MKKLTMALVLAALLPLAGCAVPYDTAYGGYDHGGGPYGGYGADCPPGMSGGDGYGMAYQPAYYGGSAYAPPRAAYYAPPPRRGYYGGGFYGSSYGWAGQPGYAEGYGRY